ncbi:MAG TPA: hypothetical protein VGR57_02460, partial [Ktedonobacterales bacterium]|nr:hypothetical protein [Ktedonobacterales bacterium]
MTRRRSMIALTAVVAVALVAGGAYATLRSTGQRAHADTPLPLAITHQHYNAFETHPVTDGATASDGGQSDSRHPNATICSTAFSPAANVNTDCEPTGPHNETSIAVNPTNPLNMIGSANDYQLSVSNGGHIYETIYSRAHVTFDGGKTWTTYPIDYASYVATGDPAVAFDAQGNAYLATLGFLFSQGTGGSNNPDV